MNIYDILLARKLRGGKPAVIEALSVTSNGIYSAPEGVDGYNPVEVTVPNNTNIIIDRTISGVYENSTATKIGTYAFYGCTELTEVSFPNVSYIDRSAFGACEKLTTVDFAIATTIGPYAFWSCRSLTSVSFPNATMIRSNAFYTCSYLISVDFPNAISVQDQAFGNCMRLTNINLPNATMIDSNVFSQCFSLSTISLPGAPGIGSAAFSSCRCLLSLYLIGSKSAYLYNSNAFYSTPIAGYTEYTSGVYGSIYVPSSLYDKYISATYWKYFSARFVSV